MSASHTTSAAAGAHPRTRGRPKPFTEDNAIVDEDMLKEHVAKLSALHRDEAAKPAKVVPLR